MAEMRILVFWRWSVVLAVAAAGVAGRAAAAQDTVFTGTNKGADRVRIAAAGFHAESGEAGPLKQTFDAVLESDLKNAGVFVRHT